MVLAVLCVSFGAIQLSLVVGRAIYIYSRREPRRDTLSVNVCTSNQAWRRRRRRSSLLVILARGTSNTSAENSFNHFSRRAAFPLFRTDSLFLSLLYIFHRRDCCAFIYYPNAEASVVWLLGIIFFRTIKLTQIDKPRVRGNDIKSTSAKLLLLLSLSSFALSNPV